jgi:hypothetical protein
MEHINASRNLHDSTKQRVINLFNKNLEILNAEVDLFIAERKIKSAHKNGRFMSRAALAPPRFSLAHTLQILL